MASPGVMGPELERLILLLGKLPGLGPRSARRVALALLQKREGLMRPLAAALAATADAIRPCTACGNLDTTDPCGICCDARRERGVVCVVETVGDLWALERAHAHKGLYHVLGGTLSALAGQRPEDLSIEPLLRRVASGGVTEVILATSATVDGQTTAHYLADRLRDSGVSLSRLSHGVPVGGELGYLDDGTLAAALSSRRPA